MHDQEYIDPNWEDSNRIHNWKNYINEDLQAAWDEFSVTQKYFIAKNAQDIADNEHWD